jgi:hypothetical protein
MEPVIVDGHANFKWIAGNGEQIEADCVESGQILLETLNILTRQL